MPVSISPAGISSTGAKVAAYAVGGLVLLGAGYYLVTYKDASRAANAGGHTPSAMAHEARARELHELMVIKPLMAYGFTCTAKQCTAKGITITSFTTAQNGVPQKEGMDRFFDTDGPDHSIRQLTYSYTATSSASPGKFFKFDMSVAFVHVPKLFSFSNGVYEVVSINHSSGITPSGANMGQRWDSADKIDAQLKRDLTPLTSVFGGLFQQAGFLKVPYACRFEEVQNFEFGSLSRIIEADATGCRRVGYSSIRATNMTSVRPAMAKGSPVTSPNLVFPFSIFSR